MENRNKRIIDRGFGTTLIIALLGFTMFLIVSWFFCYYMAKSMDKLYDKNLKEIEERLQELDSHCIKLCNDLNLQFYKYGCSGGYKNKVCYCLKDGLPYKIPYKVVY